MSEKEKAESYNNFRPFPLVFQLSAQFPISDINLMRISCTSSRV